MTVRKISKLVSSMHCMGVTALDGITSWVVLVMWCSACCSGKEVSLITIEIIEYTEREREQKCTVRAMHAPNNFTWIQHQLKAQC
jgi:hypothetical protein